MSWKWGAGWGMAAALVCASCGPSGGGAGAKPGALKVGVVFDKAGRGDKSFNDSAWRGIQRAQKELGIDVRPVDSKSAKDYESNLRALADAGYQVLFAIGNDQKDAVQAVCKDYPSVKFGLVDASVSAPNVRSLLFSEEQGSFLAGYLAALVSKTKKIGFVGGMEIPIIKKFECGYIAGAYTADPSVTVLPAKYVGDWDSQDTAKAEANVLFGSGADIVYHAAGRAGLGVIEAAKEQGKYAIGVDSDQDDIAPGSVLTSMVKHVDEAVYQTIQDVKDGKFAAGDKVYDLKSGGVGLSPMTYTKDKIGATVLAKVAAESKLIVDGKVVPPATEDLLAAFKAARPSG